MKLKLSVIIPFYNAEKTIEYCLKSVLNQTFKNFELILVNDGGTDNSLNICNSVLKINNNIPVKIINKNNTGAQDSRNTGLQISEGEYVTFIDSDDWIESEYFEKVFEQENQNDIIAVGFKKECLGQTFEISNKIASGVYTDNNIEYLYAKMLYTGKFYEAGIIPSNWSKFIKKEIALQIFPNVNINIRMGEDAVCTYGMLSISKNIKIINEIKLYHYLEIDNSISHTYDNAYFERINYIYSDLQLYFEKNKYKELLLQQLPYYIVFLIHVGLSQLCSFCKNNKIMFFSVIKKFRQDVKQLTIPELIIDKSLVDKKTYKLVTDINNRNYKHLLLKYLIG